MYANILLSTDGSDVARNGVKHGLALARALNAKVTVITVTEPLPIDYGSGHASGWIPSQEEFDRFDIAKKEHAGKVLGAGGCEYCRHTGYGGRAAIFEICIVSPQMQDLVTQNKPASILRQTAVEEGMIPLRQYGWLKVIAGLTTVEEVVRVTAADMEMLDE